MAAPRVGDNSLSDRYVRGDRLGSGGFGVVWRAHDTLLGRDVALKEIWMPAVLDEQEQAAARDKVLREARAAARLNHPGLVAVYDVAEEDGRAVIVMELVDAPTLAQLVAREGPLDDERAAVIGTEMLEALATVHEQGVIHRDVKPPNVMVHPSGRVQLADFGVASIADDPKVTGSGKLAGSPSYMAPEQAEGHPATPATDLWGLGATLYYAVEGHPPFAKDTAIATLTSVVADEPRPMQNAGRHLAPIIHDLLAKDPNARPPVEQVRRRLMDVATGASTAAPATTIAQAGPPTMELQTDDLVSRPPPRPTPTPSPRRAVRPPPPPARARPVWAMVAIAVVILAAAVAIAAVLARDRADNGAGSSAPTAAPEEGSGTPAGWVAYEDPVTGFRISHPADWSIRTSGTRTDFREPESGAYLRVEHQQPPGPSPEGAWQTLEESFASEYAGYQRIRLAPTTYKGHRAAIWEFTYSDGGARLHAADLGMIAGDYGFALYFQTHAEDWERLQPVFDGFKASFEPPE